MTTQKRSLGRRVLIGAGILVGVLVGAMGLVIVLLSKPLPKGQTGPAADELARTIEKAIDKDAWARTGAVKWTFAGRNQHLWDRQRNLDRVAWGDAYVLCDLSKQTGVAFSKHVRVGGEAEKKLVAKAYAAWINDAFWLNPLVKLFDDGVTRRVVTEPDGTPGLLISYSGGGLTPGDSYLWLLPGSPASAPLRPRAWRMWVSVLPIKGVENSWDNWTQLASGAWVATRHQVAKTSIKLEMTDVARHRDLERTGAGRRSVWTAVGTADSMRIVEAAWQG